MQFSALVAGLPHTGHLLVYGVVGASGLARLKAPPGPRPGRKQWSGAQHMSAITSPTPRKNRRKPCETVGGFEGSVLWLGQLYTINTHLHLLQSVWATTYQRRVYHHREHCGQDLSGYFYLICNCSTFHS